MCIGLLEYFICYDDFYIKGKIVNEPWMCNPFGSSMEVPTVPPVLKDIPIVQEFPDVFPSALSSMPLYRKIEFVIDIILRTAPISKTP